MQSPLEIHYADLRIAFASGRVRAVPWRRARLQGEGCRGGREGHACLLQQASEAKVTRSRGRKWKTKQVTSAIPAARRSSYRSIFRPAPGKSTSRTARSAVGRTSFTSRLVRTVS